MEGAKCPYLSINDTLVGVLSKAHNALLERKSFAHAGSFYLFLDTSGALFKNSL